jgi:hypothetical protein
VLDQNAVEEELSHAYLHAVASQARLIVERPKRDTGVDAYIKAEGKLTEKATKLSPQIDIQLKACCTLGPITEPEFSYPLKAKNYNDLRGKRSIPRLLILLVLPANKVDWLVHSDACLIARDCAYWADLTNAPEKPNTSTVTVRIKRENVVSPESLLELLRRVAENHTL